MKRFLLFTGDTFYPLGGWEDFAGSYDSLEVAKAAYTLSDIGWAHVADLDAGEIVAYQSEKGEWKDGSPWA